jgi:hypothetical protein
MTTSGQPDYNAMMIDPVHNGPTCNGYNNGDHAGTPENSVVKSLVTGAEVAAAARIGPAHGVRPRPTSASHRKTRRLEKGRSVQSAPLSWFGCPCRKCYPSRMPLKSATTSATRANPAMELGDGRDVF